MPYYLVKICDIAILPRIHHPFYFFSGLIIFISLLNNNTLKKPTKILPPFDINCEFIQQTD